MPNNTTLHTRRDVLRGLGVLGAVGVGGTAWSYPAAGMQASGSFTKTDRIEIGSFDGTTIVASFYEPAGKGPHPAVLITHGWGNSRESTAVTTLAETYASAGYAVLTYDSRGFAESGGLVGLNGPNEVMDAQQLISWLADDNRVKNDGPDDPVVGMDGYSYAAGIQLRTAAADDRLDAIVPRWAWHDLRFSNDPNGVYKYPWNYALYVGGLFGSTYAPGVKDAGADGLPDFQPKFNALFEEAVSTGEASDALREFWATRSPGPRGELEDIQTPTLLISGWHDRLFTPNEAFANYRGLRDSPGETRLLMYNGGHDLLGAPGDNDPAQLQFLTEAALSWFRQHLRGEPVPESQRLAPVTLYREATGTFESYEDLPEGTASRSLRDAAGKGTTTISTGDDGPRATSFDFPVREELDLAGVGESSLRVTPAGGDVVLSAALAKVDAAGDQTILKNQVAVRQVDRPGVVRLDLIGVEATLEPGEALRLLVGIDDADLAPGLTLDSLYSDSGAGLPRPVALRGLLGPVVPDNIAETDGLYFDSTEDPPTSLTIHHSGRGESQLALGVTEASDAPGRGRERGRGRGRGRGSD